MMKPNDDKDFSKMLKEGAFQVEENEWFTPRVVNRLPERKKTLRRFRHSLNAVAIAGCVGCWLWWGSDIEASSVVTVRDIITFTAMLAGTFTIIGSLIYDTIHPD